VSDKYAGQRDAPIVVPSGGSFNDIVTVKGKTEIGDQINKIIAKLAAANELTGVITQADFNDASKLGRGRDMQDRLTKLVGIFQGLDFSANRADGDDLLGDAYEYLMRHFATESGKSKGQFYTPAEVSRIMAKVIGIGPHTRVEQSVYDPTCGSGSLLLKAAAEAPRISIFGQEMDVATWALAKMNMILHGKPTAELWRDNTLSLPYFKNKDGSLKTFDFAVANPPFSSKAWSTGFDPTHDEHKRFEYGVPPAKNGDYAFLLHVIRSLKSTGKGAVILPRGVLFRGNREGDIRRSLVRRGLIKGIIGLPPNLFYGTGIPACIVVIDKEGAGARSGVFMIDASKGYRKDGNKNRLREQDIHKIVDVFNGMIEIAGYSRLVLTGEIESPGNDFNLNIPRYISSVEPEDLHDLDAHLRGGIPATDIDALGEYWAVFPELRRQLFEPGDRPGYDRAKVSPRWVNRVIRENPEFEAYATRVREVFAGWRVAHRRSLEAVDVGSSPSAVISALSDDLLKRFTRLPLIDRYDIFQRLMEYWDAVMQDDMFLVATDGWRSAAMPRLVIDDKAKSIREAPDLVVAGKKYKMDLMPPELVVSRFFAEGEDAVPALRIARDDAAAAVTDFVENNTGEEGDIEDVVNEKGVVTRAGVQSRLKELSSSIELKDERDALTRCLELIDAESAAEKALRNAEAKVLAWYSGMQVGQIRTLVIEDKWLGALGGALDDEVERVIQRLAQRVTELDERYASTLPSLEREAVDLTSRVEGHLRGLGFSWT
jgi:type I restriction enzyme M protein